MKLSVNCILNLKISCLSDLQTDSVVVIFRVIIPIIFNIFSGCEKLTFAINSDKTVCGKTTNIRLFEVQCEVEINLLSSG